MLLLTLAATAAGVAHATEYHVSKTGSDADPGTEQMPLLTISAAARMAQPGDVVTVHAVV
jgi:alpha-N-arabinofuranosidase